KDPQQFHPWDDASRQGYAALADGADPGEPPAERYRLFNEGLARLRERHRLHPLEVPAVLTALATEGHASEFEAAGLKSRGKGAGPTRFRGFCSDTFRFLAELGQNNRRDWMERQRDRY